MKIKLRIHEIRKETFKLLSNCFGISIEPVNGKSDSKTGVSNAQTPDFYNTRINRHHRKNLNINRCPE
jgi:hypothetical protein